MKLGIIKSFIQTLKANKTANSVFLLRKQNKDIYKDNRQFCLYMNVKPSIENMKSLNMKLPLNVKTKGE